MMQVKMEDNSAISWNKWIKNPTGLDTRNGVLELTVGPLRRKSNPCPIPG